MRAAAQVKEVVDNIPEFSVKGRQGLGRTLSSIERRNMMKLAGGPAFCSIILGFSLFPNTGRSQDWWVAAGPVFRPGLRVSVGGTSYVQALGLHDPLASGSLSSPGGIGDLNSYADRSYDNGYVKRDPGTGYPTTIDPNTTWNWGFNDPGQYNAGARTLTFQKTGAAGYASAPSGSAQASEDTLGVGLQLLGGFPLKEGKKWSLELCLGFQAIWGSDDSLSTSAYRESVRQIKVTDTYDVSGIPAARFPAGGFHGTYLGPFDSPPVIPSPVIPNLPKSRSSSAGTVLSSSYNSIAFNLDQNLFQIAVGPRLNWAATRRISANLRPTVSLNVVGLDAQRTERFIQDQTGTAGRVLRSWSDQSTQYDVLLGLGVTGGIDLDLGKGFFAGIFGGYEWVIDEAKASVGPSTVALDCSGFVAGALLGKRF
jgi:hypothetical protein